MGPTAAGRLSSLFFDFWKPIFKERERKKCLWKLGNRAAARSCRQSMQQTALLCFAFVFSLIRVCGFFFLLFNSPISKRVFFSSFDVGVVGLFFSFLFLCRRQCVWQAPFGMVRPVGHYSRLYSDCGTLILDGGRGRF